MPMLISIINDINIVEFDNGSFDSWCVYLKRGNNKRYSPKDIEYFTFFQQQGLVYGNKNVYNDFVEIYKRTNNELDPNVLKFIKEISASYTHNAEEMEIWFTIIYAAMIAEENKANAILKKRIKRLGMYQVLIQNMKPEEAAQFSRGKSASSLNILMNIAGF